MSKLVFRFLTFSADIDVDDLSTTGEQARIREVVSFLHELDVMMAAAGIPRPAQQPPAAPQPQPQPQQPPRAAVAGDGEWIDVAELEVTLLNGARRYRVRGGKFVKYGVPLYEDTCKLSADHRAALAALPPGLHTPPFGHAFVVIADGKPVRVTEVS